MHCHYPPLAAGSGFSVPHPGDSSRAGRTNLSDRVFPLMGRISGAVTIYKADSHLEDGGGLAPRDDRRVYSSTLTPTEEHSNGQNDEVRRLLLDRLTCVRND